MLCNRFPVFQHRAAAVAVIEIKTLKGWCILTIVLIKTLVFFFFPPWNILFRFIHKSVGPVLCYCSSVMNIINIYYHVVVPGIENAYLYNMYKGNILITVLYSSRGILQFKKKIYIIIFEPPLSLCHEFIFYFTDFSLNKIHTNKHLV